MSAHRRVLVTGAAGNLGGRTARLLVAGGDEVFGTTRREVKGSAGDASPVHWLSCDLTKLDELRAAIEASKPTHVLHTAGLAGDRDLSELIDANVIALENLVELLVGVQVERVLVVGSAAEYAASGRRESIREGDVLGPTSRYGLSKLYQFELSQMALRAGLPIVYTRLFNLIGPGVSCTTAVGDISKRLADAIKGDGPAVLEVGDLDRWRDYVDVRDAAEAYRLLLQSAPPGGVYNVCSGVPVQLADIVDRLLSFAGKDVQLRRVERKPSLEYVIGDSSKLRALGWSQAYDLDTSLRDGLSAIVEAG